MGRAVSRTASYAVEFHPDAPHDLDSMFVTFQVCDRCGAIVHDDLLHGTWHDRLDVLSRDVGTTTP